MGIKERREREKQYVRTMIMKIVNQLVSEEGWSGVTIRKIAEEIEYSPPIIYEHFESKEAILLELTREAFSKMLKLFDKGVKDAKSPLDALHIMVRINYDFCIQHKGYAKAIFGLDGVPSGVYLDLEEWNEITAMFKKNLMEAAGFSDSQDNRIMDGFMQLRWVTRGGISSAVVRLQNEGKEYPFNDHEKMKSILCEAIDFIVEGLKRRHSLTQPIGA